jgi:hypothetical protein
MVVIAFLIGYFLSNMISGSSSGSGSRVKAVGVKHLPSNQPVNCPSSLQNEDDKQLKRMKDLCYMINNSDDQSVAVASEMMKQCYDVGEDKFPGCIELGYADSGKTPKEQIDFFKTR